MTTALYPGLLQRGALSRTFFSLWPLSFLKHVSLSARTSKAFGVDAFPSRFLSAVHLGKDLSETVAEAATSRGLSRELQPSTKFVLSGLQTGNRINAPLPFWLEELH